MIKLRLGTVLCVCLIAIFTSACSNVKTESSSEAIAADSLANAELPKQQFDIPLGKPNDLSTFNWISPAKGKRKAHEKLKHLTFFSKKNNSEVGFYIYVPDDYFDPENLHKRYPVIYHLHGGRPGAEFKGIGRFNEIYQAIQDGKMPEVIYVSPNGGLLSHYDHHGVYGEQAFLELIKHVDGNYRTISDRKGRLLQGGSQGGRGVCRYLFKHPHLFASAVAMAAGHQWEYEISQNLGRESAFLTIDDPKNNTWHLLQAYGNNKNAPEVKLMTVIGDKDRNYPSNVAYHKFAQQLGVDSKLVVAKNAGHGLSFELPETGSNIFKFHADVLKAGGIE